MKSLSIKGIIKKILALFPLKNIIIFESNPDFTDNTYWMFKYMVENQQIQNRYKLVWFVKKPENKVSELCGVKITCVDYFSNSVIEKIKKAHYNSRAKFIIDCNVFVHKYSEKQVRVYLSHGMPLKAVDKFLSENYDVDLLTLTSSYFKPYFSKFINFENMQVLGSPRNDALVINIKKPKLLEGYKTIIWMPTYRQHKASHDYSVENIFPLGIPVFKTVDESKVLNDKLISFNTILLLRPHPVQDLSVLNIGEYSNIIIANDRFLEDNGVQLYELLSVTDALITDYSSIYYDYLLLNRPIALTLEDIESFSSKWPLIFSNPEKEFIGEKICTKTEFFDFIKNVSEEKDLLKEKRKISKNLFNEANDLNSSERIYNYIKNRWNI